MLGVDGCVVPGIGNLLSCVDYMSFFTIECTCCIMCKMYNFYPSISLDICFQKDPTKEYKTAEDSGIHTEYVNAVYDTLMKAVSLFVEYICRN